MVLQGLVRVGRALARRKNCGIELLQHPKAVACLHKYHSASNPHSNTYKMASPNMLRGKVTFHPDVQFEKQTTRKHQYTMTTDLFQGFEAERVTDAMLADAAGLFNNHYGIWGTPPPGHRGGKPGIPPRRANPSTANAELGDRVKMTAARLRREYLPADARCSYISVHVDGVLAGNAFVCRWNYQDRQVCWITQLVVHQDYRGYRLATHLLVKSREADDEIFGIMSSHPFACIAAAKACSGEWLVAACLVGATANSSFRRRFRQDLTRLHASLCEGGNGRISDYLC